MKCPECGKDTMVIDSRSTSDSVRRRRECNEGHRFSTQEWVVRSSTETRSEELLRLIREHPGSNYKDLSGMMSTSREHISGLVGELITRKLIVKETIRCVNVYPIGER